LSDPVPARRFHHPVPTARRHFDAGLTAFLGEPDSLNVPITVVAGKGQHAATGL